MKISRIILVASLIVFIGYLLYLGIGMSYTYPHIKDYCYDINKVSFEKKLAVRIDSSNGWSLEMTDSLNGKNDSCYRATLFYEGNGQKLKYRIKYCSDSKESFKDSVFVRLGVVGAFDHINKNGGYKLSDGNVEKLLDKLDSAILNELAPRCSNP